MTVPRLLNCFTKFTWLYKMGLIGLTLFLVVVALFIVVLALVVPKENPQQEAAPGSCLETT